jgi:surface antigen
VAAPAQGATRQVLSDCLQTREYQTEIVIDGQPVPAYGTACLQADGSWKIVSGPFAAD